MSDTAHCVGHDLSHGTPFVLYGLLRYQLLVHRGSAENPAEVFVTDRP